MPINQETLNSDLFRLLKSRGYQPTMLDSSGKQMAVPDDAEVFQFIFKKDKEEYGTVTVSVDGLHKLVVYYNDTIANSPSGSRPGEDNSWYDFIRQLKKWSKNHQLSFELKDEDNLKYDMAKREHTRLDEGYHALGKRQSYNDSIPSVKIKLQHTRDIQEGEQRYRNVARIYLENIEGERFLLNTTKPGLARVYARHIAEGGRVNDDRWNHINEMVEDYNKMAGFVRATRNNQFNESAQDFINEGVTHYGNLREALRKLTGKRGYNAYFESWTPTLIEDTIGQPDLAETFKTSHVDPRIESAIPIIARITKVSMKPMDEVTELEEWSNNLVDEALMPSNDSQQEQLVDLLSNELPVGPDAKNAKSLLAQNHLEDDDLSDILEKISAEDPDEDVRGEVLNFLKKSKDHRLHSIADRVEQLSTPAPAAMPQQPAPVAAPAPAPVPVQEEQKDGDYVKGADKAKSIGPVLGAKSKQHPFKGKLVGSASESVDLNRILNLSGIIKD
jgi:hypothetical protein